MRHQTWSPTHRSRVQRQAIKPKTLHLKSLSRSEPTLGQPLSYCSRATANLGSETEKRAGSVQLNVTRKLMTQELTDFFFDMKGSIAELFLIDHDLRREIQNPIGKLILREYLLKRA